MRHRFAIISLVMTAMLSVTQNAVSSEAAEWIVPEEAVNLENPYPEALETVKQGETLFTRQCVACHGSSGKGDGPAGKYLGRPLPDFTTAAIHEQTDGELYWKISIGRAPMPTFKEILSDEQRWQIVDYLRTLGPAKQKGGSE